MKVPQTPPVYRSRRRYSEAQARRIEQRNWAEHERLWSLAMAADYRNFNRSVEESWEEREARFERHIEAQQALQSFDDRQARDIRQAGSTYTIRAALRRARP